MGERIGILGGTFNPVHLGHLVLAQDARERFELDRVLLVPCASPPHKDARDLAPAAHRLAMLEAAVEADPALEVSAIEIERGGVSWTVETLRELRARHPDADLVFVIGADTLRELRTWRRIEEIFTLCRFAVITRPGVAPAGDPDELGLPEPQARRLLAAVVPGHDIGISSSDIRMRVAEGLAVRYLVPDTVALYIAEHRLYLE